MESKTEGTIWKNIRNCLRNRCQKWPCILFGANYQCVRKQIVCQVGAEVSGHRQGKPSQTFSVSVVRKIENWRVGLRLNSLCSTINLHVKMKQNAKIKSCLDDRPLCLRICLRPSRQWWRCERSPPAIRKSSSGRSVTDPVRSLWSNLSLPAGNTYITTSVLCERKCRRQVLGDQRGKRLLTCL